MTKFHSTVSRRDFMKGLGLAGAGLGSAALVAPGFKDLDALTSSAPDHSHRWWVKQRDFEDITTPVDWDIFQQYDNKANPPYSRSAAASAFNTARDNKDLEEGLSKKIPGRSLRDIAYNDSGNRVPPSTPWNGPTDGVTSPVARGTVAWQDTAENNLQTCRAAIHGFGCNNVGVLEVNEHTKRIFNKGAVVWEDIEEGFQDSQKVYHIPNKCKYILTWAPQQNYIQGMYGLRYDDSYPSGFGVRVPLGAAASARAYGDQRMIGYMVMRFIKNLGYQAYKAGVSANVALGIFSGLGEQGRSTHLCTPDKGLQIRLTDYAITDLPLAPTPPIDAGIFEFCKKCKRCGEGCPSESISMADDASWDPAVPSNRPGFRGWYLNWNTCIDFGSPQACMNCQTICPFNHPSEGLIHPAVRITAAATPIFNSFFGSMDRAFGYGRPKSEQEMEEWWHRDFNTWKGDTIVGAGRFQW